jgi:hypothetical protein
MKLFLALFATLIPAGPLQISPESKDLIVEFETGGRSGYVRRPEWPGGASGVTVGIGYDIGYNTRAAVLSDWKSLPEGSRNALASAAGVKGVAAKSRAAALRWVIVPWENAEALFVSNTMPRFGNLTANAYRGVLTTNGHIQGVMLSITFNRGDDKRGDRRRELAAIDRDLMADPQRLSDLPVQIRAMKRLWVGKGLPGLLRRRDAEASLIERTLNP